VIEITQIATQTGGQEAPVSDKNSNPGGQVWVWLPGWSFAATVFEPLYKALPGTHLLVDYRCNESMTNATHTIAAQVPDNAIWCGWSLGGALAQQICASKAHKALVTLGTGKRFIGSALNSDIVSATDSSIGSSTDSWGMPEPDFSAFKAAFEVNPAKTLKRFNALVTQGSPDARSLVRILSAHQSEPSPELTTTLSWLDYGPLPDVPGAVHLYGNSDALTPGGLTPATESAGNSHAFFLEEAGHQQLLVNLIKHLPLQNQELMNNKGDAHA